MAQPTSIAKPMQQLESQLTSINRMESKMFTEQYFDYILTPDEEAQAIEWEILRLQNEHRAKLYRWGTTKEDADKNINSIDWSNQYSIEKILFTANANKLIDIEDKQRAHEQQISREEAWKNIVDKWTAPYLLKYMKYISEKKYGKELIINDDTRQLITPLAYFLTNDPRFETSLGKSFKKGLWFRGVSGQGKTFIAAIAKDNKINPLLYTNLNKITKVVKDYGRCNINVNGFGKVYLDDVGTESPLVNYYGTEVRWFKEFIEDYHFDNKPFNKLIVSTNCSFAQISEKYTHRITRRIQEMFNVIDLTALPFDAEPFDLKTD